MGESTRKLTYTVCCKSVFHQPFPYYPSKFNAFFLLESQFFAASNILINVSLTSQKAQMSMSFAKVTLHQRQFFFAKKMKVAKLKPYTILFLKGCISLLFYVNT